MLAFYYRSKGAIYRRALQIQPLPIHESDAWAPVGRGPGILDCRGTRHEALVILVVLVAFFVAIGDFNNYTVRVERSSLKVCQQVHILEKVYIRRMSPNSAKNNDASVILMGFAPHGCPQRVPLGPKALQPQILSARFHTL